MKILYKQGINALQIWKGRVEDDRVVIEHGQAGGNLQTELIPFGSQAEAYVELKRRTDKKMDREGYTEEIPDSPPEMPMLAHKYVDYEKSVPKYVYVQPKLDGIRCIGSNKGLLTRRNDIITAMPHVTKALKDLPDGLTLDGELYCHDKDFQDHLSMIKRGIPTNEGMNSIKYHVFDMINDDTYEKRVMELEELVYLLPKWVVPVETLLIHRENIDIKLQEYIDEGYEGMIIRDPEGKYMVGRRSRFLLKYKKFITDEFQIVDIVAASKGREQGAAIFVCETSQGHRFKARPKFPLYERTAIYDNKDRYMGWWTRITYADLTRKGIPSKPIADGLSSSKKGLN